MKNFDFLFKLNELSDNEGEQFLVECETLEQAFDIVDENFEREVVTYIGKLTVAEGEALGYDIF